MSLWVRYRRILVVNKVLNLSVNTGGTVDISAVEVVDDVKLRQLHYAVGGPYGGGAVDKNFVELLNDVFGADKMEMFKQFYPTSYLEFLSVSVKFVCIHTTILRYMQTYLCISFL